MLYIIDRTINEVSKVTIAPIHDFNKGETYTLWIKDVKGTNEKVIRQNVKMAFTIEGNNEVTNIQ